MAIIDQSSTGALATTRQPGWIARNWGLLLAIAALAIVLALPTPAGLPVAGHRMLAILAFAVIVWMTEAVDYAVSAIVIATLMAFLLGFSPNPANPQALIGTGAALTLAFVVRRRRWSRRSTASRRRRFRSTPTGCTIGDTP